MKPREVCDGGRFFIGNLRGCNGSIKVPTEQFCILLTAWQAGTVVIYFIYFVYCIIPICSWHCGWQVGAFPFKAQPWPRILPKGDLSKQLLTDVFTKHPSPCPPYLFISTSRGIVAIPAAPSHQSCRLHFLSDAAGAKISSPLDHADANTQLPPPMEAKG